jgi:uncharacterized protein
VYTRAVEFDWDDANIDHIAKHGLIPEEAEEALLDPKGVNIGAYNTPTEKRNSVLGATEGGRILRVVYTKRYGNIRVVTARDANKTEKRIYRGG